MSALLVYLVLQANTIILVLAIVGGVLLIAAFMVSMESNFKESDALTQRWKKFLGAAVATLAVTALIPSTSTMAAMYILPKLTSPEVVEPVSREAKELYSLAKKALANVAKEPAEEAKEH